MSLPVDMTAWMDWARPHALALGLVVARIAPATFLCPAFGGQAAPTTVRLGLCLALAAHAHFAGGLAPCFGPDADAWTVIAAYARELLCGTAIGFVAALPFDAARMGGRFLDTFRGANAEAMLPATGSREAASGDFLYQLLCALVFVGPAYHLLAGAVLGSFRATPLGVPGLVATDVIVELAVVRATSALAAGLAIGAPCAAVALLVDAALGVAARAAPGLPIQELGAPAKLLAGAAGILFGLGLISQRLLGELAEAAESIHLAAGALGGAS